MKIIKFKKVAFLFKLVEVAAFEELSSLYDFKLKYYSYSIVRRYSLKCLFIVVNFVYWQIVDYKWNNKNTKCC